LSSASDVELAAPHSAHWKSVSLEKSMVYYNAEQPDFFVKNWGASTIGLMGNAPFWNEILVLDFGTYPALGILR
jgi:hypothetical protein